MRLYRLDPKPIFMERKGFKKSPIVVVQCNRGMANGWTNCGNKQRKDLAQPLQPSLS